MTDKKKEILLKRGNGLLKRLERLRKRILKSAWKHPDNPAIQKFKKWALG